MGCDPVNYLPGYQPPVSAEGLDVSAAVNDLHGMNAFGKVNLPEIISDREVKAGADVLNLGNLDHLLGGHSGNKLEAHQGAG